MQSEWQLIARTQSADQTKRLAAQLAAQLKPGDVILLSGDLGAGKTQFVQGVAHQLGAADIPISPTFNIVVSYETRLVALHHFDLYRLDSAEQLEDIGLREYLESDGVCFVEWAEKFPEAFDAHLAVRIAKEGETGRAVFARAQGERPSELLSSWLEALLCGSDADGDAGTNGGDGPDPESSCDPSKVPSPVRIASDREDHDGLAPSLPEGASAPAHDVPLVSPDDAVAIALDTANEVVALGVGVLDEAARAIRPIATREIAAHRASNTTLLPALDALLSQIGVGRRQVVCVCAGRGPGSFTGVRIAMATAKGIAQALGVGLVGVSTLDAIAWNAQASGVRGNACVVADAMRKEVYPVRFSLFDGEVRRLGADRVVKADLFAEELSADGMRAGECGEGSAADLLLLGDALVKYREKFEPFGAVLSDKLWEVTGRGLLLALQDAWRRGEADPFDAKRHDPAYALPVYTRLSDAEEHERIKLARTDERNLVSGVQDVDPDGGVGRATMHSQAKLAGRPDANGMLFRPLDAADAEVIASLEADLMGSDAWSARLVADELGQRNRSWWVAECGGILAGYAGGMVVDGDLQVLKIAVAPPHRRRGIARALLAHVAEDARNLGASTCSLEVRASNGGARAFYADLGLETVGVRPRYYSDREDAVIMKGPLPEGGRDVAGMALQHLDRAGRQAAEGLALPDSDGRRARPDDAAGTLILAIESSCDETAAAVVGEDGVLLSDVVASQIDFHSRFGGVVPEIASRKHIEAICGVCAEGLEDAGAAWSDLDAIAVTYAPGLLGALVVGVAFAKGAAWALDVPFIGVNHLEGHLYANKVGAPGFGPPAVVSLVSGGNTMLVHMRDWGDYRVLGETIDDAVGEAFDKVSKALGLGYPGGSVISRHAARGNPDAIAFPRAMLHSHDYRFSLSGLKTAVVNYINGERAAGRELALDDIAASFQQAVVDVQVAKAEAALVETGARTFCLGGGVAANPVLRAAYEDMCARLGVDLVMPPLSSCGDNAGMIALVALDRFRDGKFFSLDADAAAHANLEEPY